jgi:ribose/xylose/arabinose/galactoside ABC-type transport system permease subunit
MVQRKRAGVETQRKSFNIFNLSIYLVFALLLVVFSALSPHFLTFSNVYSTLLNGAPLILIACAITYALITGIIDLSVAAVSYLAGSVCGILLHNVGLPIWVAFLAGILVGVILGGINSLLIVRFRMNFLLTTLGMMLALRGVGKIITRDRTILMGAEISALRQTKIDVLGGFPVVVIVAILVVILSQIILTKTKIGRHMIAVGCDAKAAATVGINVPRVRSFALLMTSGICGLAGVVWVITLGAVITRGLNAYEFLAIASAVLGGTSLFGGRGSFLPGSFLGALVLLFIADGLTIAGASPYIMPFVRGSIIFIAMYADSLRVRFES